MNYKEIDPEHYYRKEVFRHFTQDCKCSLSITSRVDVTALADHARRVGSKFYIDFLYLLSRTLNSREDYRMQYLYQEEKLVVFDRMDPAHYVFHEDTETFTVVYTEYDPDYALFYQRCAADIERAKQTRAYCLDPARLNTFDASYISWLSYDALHLELPDGYLHFPPILNWGRYREENGRLLLPLSVRINHAAADGYLVSKVFLTLEAEIARFVNS